MNDDPFSGRPFDKWPALRSGGGRRMARPPEPSQPAEPYIPPAAAAPDKPKPKRAILRDPAWESEKVGFNEETGISVHLDLPSDLAHKTRVSFVLFAKTPRGPERISQGEAHAKNGKAICLISVYIPAYRDEEGNPPRKVDYFFHAEHPDAEPLDGSRTPKRVEEMADRVLEAHILQNLTFASGSSFIRASEANDLKSLGRSVKDWKAKHGGGELAGFRAWFMLQHLRGYLPFWTMVVTEAEIHGEVP